jgi:hypothetical protein
LSRARIKTNERTNHQNTHMDDKELKIDRHQKFASTRQYAVSSAFLPSSNVEWFQGRVSVFTVGAFAGGFRNISLTPSPPHLHSVHIFNCLGAYVVGWLAGAGA